ncbi:hypothetical protein D3C71_1564720 [compost metagenome]
MLGFTFWITRTYYRFVYGLGEVIFGISAAFAIGLNPSSNALANVVALVGAIYVVVRGIDNADEGSDRGIRKKLRWSRNASQISPPTSLDTTSPELIS